MTRVAAYYTSLGIVESKACPLVTGKCKSIYGMRCKHAHAFNGNDYVGRTTPGPVTVLCAATGKGKTK